MHRGLTPDDILITMGGGDAGGHSCFIPSWSRGRGSIMQHAAIAAPTRGVKPMQLYSPAVDHAQAQGVPRARARQHRRPAHRHPRERQAQRRGDAERGGAAVRAAQRLHRPHARLEEERQRAGARQHPGQGRAGGRLPASPAWGIEAPAQRAVCTTASPSNNSASARWCCAPTPFEVTARNIARVLGLPDYPFLTVQHPIGSCTLPELKARAEIAYKQALPILLQG